MHDPAVAQVRVAVLHTRVSPRRGIDLAALGLGTNAVAEIRELTVEPPGILPEWHGADAVVPGGNGRSARTENVFGHRWQDEPVAASVGAQDRHGRRSDPGAAVDVGRDESA